MNNRGVMGAMRGGRGGNMGGGMPVMGGIGSMGGMGGMGGMGMGMGMAAGMNPMMGGMGMQGQGGFHTGNAQYNAAFFNQAQAGGSGADLSWNPHGAKRTRQE